MKGFAHKEQLLKLYHNQLRALKFYKEMLKQRSLAQLSSPENKPRDLSNRTHKTRKNTVNWDTNEKSPPQHNTLVTWLVALATSARSNSLSASRDWICFSLSSSASYWLVKSNFRSQIYSLCFTLSLNSFHP